MPSAPAGNGALLVQRIVSLQDTTQSHQATPEPPEVMTVSAGSAVSFNHNLDTNLFE